MPAVMNASSSRSSVGRALQAERHSDRECQAKAGAYLEGLIGAPPDDLRWDLDHHLQGHAHLGSRELVVIAPRDNIHEPIVLIAEDWDEIRRASGDSRRQLLRQCAIADHDQLVALLAS